MSASDDYDRHRLRTDTKFVKVSLKPFQRLGGVRGGSPEKNSWRVTGRQPREKINGFELRTERVGVGWQERLLHGSFHFGSRSTHTRSHVLI